MSNKLQDLEQRLQAAFGPNSEVAITVSQNKGFAVRVSDQTRSKKKHIRYDFTINPLLLQDEQRLTELFRDVIETEGGSIWSWGNHTDKPPPGRRGIERTPADYIHKVKRKRR